MLAVTTRINRTPRQDMRRIYQEFLGLHKIRKQHFSMTSNYQDLKAVAKSLDEKNDCAVKAVAIVADMTYKCIHTHFAYLGRRHGRRIKDIMTFRVLAMLKIFVVDVTSNFKSKTVRTLARELPTEGRFLIWTRGHLLAARDGKICDWTEGHTHRILKIMKMSS